MKIFKSLVSALLALSMLLAFAACTAEDDPKVTTTKNNTKDEFKLSDEQISLFQGYASQNALRAKEMTDATISAYMDDMTYKRLNTVLVADKCTVSNDQQTFKRKDVCSVWGYTAFMAMISHMMPISDSANQSYYNTLYKASYDSLDYYEGTGSVMTYKEVTNCSLYAVNRAMSKGTANISGINAVYDDQMWLIREMIYVYKLTGEQAYFDEAIRLTDICLDGWDVTKDEKGNEIGGICWGPGYSSKHTCSNAPMILPLVQLSELYKEKGDQEKADYYLNWAVKVYDFCVKYFAHGQVYGDLVGSERKTEGSGKNAHYVTTAQSNILDTSTYTYNTGTMISGAAALYRATGDIKYQRVAVRNARGAITHFTDKKILDGYSLWPIDAQHWFNLIMLEGYIELYSVDPDVALKGIETFQKTLDYGYEHYNSKGFLPANYLTGWNMSNNKDKEKLLMDQTAAAQMFAMLSAFYSQITA